MASTARGQTEIAGSNLDTAWGHCRTQTLGSAVVEPGGVHHGHHEALRAWARGLYPLEATTELLIRGCGGRFASTGQAWVHVEDRGRAWIDFDELTEQLAAGGPWSGGERRLLVLAVSLGADGGLLNDNLAGLDRDNLALVLAAVSLAGGSHEHGPIAILFDDDDDDDAGRPAGRPYRNPDRERPGPLYPWKAAGGGAADQAK